MLRRERLAFGILTIALGLAALWAALTALLNVGAMGGIGLVAHQFLTPVWALWLGIDLLRRP